MHEFSHEFSSSILRKYDIRGIVGKDLHEVDAYALGIAFGCYLKNQNLPLTVVVIKDARASGILLKENLIKGLIGAGCEVFDCGTGTTPLCYFASHNLNVSGFVAVTGSHNSVEYNGFKFGITGGAFSEEKILEVAELAKNLEVIGGGCVRDVQFVKREYIERILKDLPSIGNLKIGFNALNGSAGVILPELAKQIGGEVKVFECEMNPQLETVLDPSNTQNIERMQKDLERENLDIIFAFDGDADRIMAITKQKVFYGEDVLFLCVREVFSKIKNGNVIFDVKCSNILKKEIEKCGGTPIMYKTGHSFIKEKMLVENAVLGGEGSGHIYFKNGYYGFDDGIYTAIRLISYLVTSKKQIGEIINEMPFVWKSTDIKIHCVEKFAVIEKIQLLMNKMGVEFNNIDGIRCEISKSAWFLVRASNTEEILVVKYEAETNEEFTKVAEFVKEILGKFNMEF